MKLYSYNQASESAKALSEALGIKRLKHEGGVVRGDVINWGSSNVSRQINGVILNAPDAVARAVNKLSAFRALSDFGVSVPQYTTDREEAVEWLIRGADVVARQKLTGYGGEGIDIVTTQERAIKLLVDAPLYTNYIKKKEEYRIHVMHGEAFFVQRKARKLDVPDEEVNWKVRNLAGGFIYANQDVGVDEEAKEQAIMAVHALGLDFGAVDVILGTDKQFYVLEVNTACGLAGTTLDKYVEQFNRF